MKKGGMKKAKLFAALGASTVAGIALIIGGFFVIFTFREMVDNMILSELPLRKEGRVTEAWLHPPVRPLFRIYFFNTTNPKGFLRGEKPQLQEVGPYTWEERWEKVGVSWDSTGEKMKFSTKRTYRFRRDLSAGDITDKVTLPNIPMIATLYSMRFAGELVHQAISSMLDILKQEVFNSTTVGELIWGYDHPLIKLGNEVLPPEQKLPFDKFGFFVNRNNSVEGVFEVMTGISKVADIGKVVSFKGKTKLDFWNSEECNSIRGTDGTIFHPNLNKNETLHIFNIALCQSLPLTFQEEVVHHGITSYRFVPPSNVFGTPAENPKNKCFCKDGACAQSGLFNITACQFGSPLLFSWPHFFQADPRLLDDVTGLNPEQEKHQFQIDIIPKMGIGMRAAVRSQINLAMQDYEHVKQMKGVRKIIYPILWFQTGLDEISDSDTLAMLNLALVTPELARNVMIPVFFIVGIILLISVFVYFFRKSHVWKELLKGSKDKGIQLPDSKVIRTPPPDYHETEH